MRLILIYLFTACFFYASVNGQTFSSNSQSFYNVAYSAICWGDYNNDGYLDIFLTGIDGSDIKRCAIYLNNGNGSFIEQSLGFTALYHSSATWGDYNNDGYIDILYCGYNGAGSSLTYIYKNNGNNTFTQQAFSIIGVHVASLAWGDYDNDGFLDFALTGWNHGTSSLNSKIYKNNGNNSFSEQTGISITPVISGTVAWGDYDNDGDLDLLLCGSTVNSGNGNPVTKIYRNNGNGTFTQLSVSLLGLTGSAGGRNAAWGDYDNDGDIDILITGNDNTGTRHTKIYRNDGNDSFSEQTGISIPGLTSSSVSWGDYDNNGYLDILMSGYNGSSYLTKIYKNNGDYTFTDSTSRESFYNIWGMSIWGDYDNDGKLDILLSGEASGGLSDRHTKLYRNLSINANTAPNAPGNLSVSINNQDATFTWDKSTDSQTGQDGLSYNIYVYEQGQTNFVLPPHANTTTGFRRVAQIGNVQWQEDGYTLHNLAQDNTYYWSVQAVDAGFVGGQFATDSPIPVELESFYAFIKNYSVNLFWNTITEVNNSGFQVERSTDGRNWYPIGFVAGNGNSNITHDYDFIDNDIKTSGTLFYRLKQIDNNGNYQYSKIISIVINILTKFDISQNYPNPFNPSTKIKYTISNSPPFTKGERQGGLLVTLKVYDILGREITTLVSEEQQPGIYEIEFVGRSETSALPNGIYFYRLQAGDYTAAKKMILLK